MLLHRELGRNFKACLGMGAGWGRTSETLIQHTLCETYIIVDLSEPLCPFPSLPSQCFSGSSLPLPRHPKRGGGGGGLPEKGIIFLLPNQNHWLKGRQFDIGLNINSFQEMPGPEIARYLSLFDETCRVAFFSNKTESYKLDHKIVTDIKDYPIPDSWERIYNQRSEVHDSFVNQIYKNRRECDR